MLYSKHQITCIWLICISVTEREVVHGILQAENVDDHCLAYLRNINNVNTTLLSFASKFVDFAARAVDSEAQRYLKLLRDDKLPKKLPSENIARFDVDWSGKDGIDKEAHAEYLKSFTAHYEHNIKRLIDNAMAKDEEFANDSVYADILQHLHACNTFCTMFEGREEVLEKLQDYITGK